MKYFKLLSLILILSCLSNCMGKFRMTPEKFSNLTAQEKSNMVVFKVNLNYSGNNVDLYPRSKCYLSFKNSTTKNLDFKISKATGYGNYVFVNLENPNDHLYLNDVRCSEYKVFYNKKRLKHVNKYLTSAHRNNKIKYGGDIDIYWIPKGFNVSDLFNLGDLGIDDNGSFTLRNKNNYNAYLRFMRQTHNVTPSQTSNILK